MIISVRTPAQRLEEIYAEIRAEYPSARLEITGDARTRTVDVFTVDVTWAVKATCVAFVHEVLTRHEPREVQECFEWLS
jgi:hypothetical protein